MYGSCSTAALAVLIFGAGMPPHNRIRPRPEPYEGLRVTAVLIGLKESDTIAIDITTVIKRQGFASAQ